MHLCMWSLLLRVCVRGVVGFSSSLTSTPRCDPIWSSAVRQVWAKAAEIGFTWVCAYGRLTKQPASCDKYIILQTLELSCMRRCRVSSMSFWCDFQCKFSRRQVCTVLVHDNSSSAVCWRGLVNIYDRVFPLMQARLLGAPVWQHTLLTAKHLAKWGWKEKRLVRVGYIWSIYVCVCVYNRK